MEKKRKERKIDCENCVLHAEWFIIFILNVDSSISFKIKHT